MNTNRRTKRNRDGPLKGLSRWLLDNQIAVCFNLIAILATAHICIPIARPYTSKFFKLSYYNPNTAKYAIGHDDFYFIAFSNVLLTGLRAGSMEYVLTPLAKRLGISKKKGIVRFSEQVWMLMYYNVFWPLGMYIYYTSPYFLSMDQLWTDWPHRELAGLMKGYILIQWSYWVQQVLVIHMEERRKDHWQMLTHHIVTIMLMAAAYAYHQTRVANLILVMTDVIDVVLPLAKCLKYLGFTTICDILFGVFVGVWLLTRHVFFVMTCWSVYSDLPRLIQPGCYSGTVDNLQGPFPTPDDWYHLLDPFVNPSGTVCWNNNIRLGFLSYLLSLQAMMVLWSTIIIRVATRFVQGNSAEDIRSDDDDEEEEGEEEMDEEVEPIVAQPIEEEVSVESIDLKGWRRRTGAQRARGSGGLSFRGRSSREEILNRIGCETKIE